MKAYKKREASKNPYSGKRTFTTFYIVNEKAYQVGAPMRSSTGKIVTCSLHQLRKKYGELTVVA